jgi:hypothetical protein
MGLAHLVTAGRYDGLDLEGDTCRLVVIPSVPAGSTEFERFAVAYLSDASFMRHRVGQRVTQALGRANRAAADSGLYLGLDPSFAGALADPSVYNSLGPEVRDVVRRALEGMVTGGRPRALRAGLSDTRADSATAGERCVRQNSSAASCAKRCLKLVGLP